LGFIPTTISHLQHPFFTDISPLLDFLNDIGVAKNSNFIVILFSITQSAPKISKPQE